MWVVGCGVWVAGCKEPPPLALEAELDGSGGAPPRRSIAPPPPPSASAVARAKTDADGDGGRAMDRRGGGRAAWFGNEKSLAL